MFQLRDCNLAVVACRVRAGCGCRLDSVELSGPALAAAGAPATLHAKRNALIFSSDTWAAPQRRRDADLNKTLCRHAQPLLTRTFQRRLRLKGVSFDDLPEELRARLAREYLAGRKLNISEASCLLGFSEPSAFSWAFKRWTGVSPQAFLSIPRERVR
jgi:AraC-like DNA-binding protein